MISSILKFSSKFNYPRVFVKIRENYEVGEG